ncbi:MAG TPA: hypothetical protein VFI47_13575 [Acidimicrobiales bacterium]|nr:hypothetical protein [Acidimicrobiales bacterium]
MATVSLGRLTGALEEQLARWEQQPARHGVRPGDCRVYAHAARLAVDRAAARLAAVQPEWLVDLLGGRPDAPPAVVRCGTMRSGTSQRTEPGMGSPIP